MPDTHLPVTEQQPADIAPEHIAKAAADRLFLNARTPQSWSDRPVPVETLHRLYGLIGLAAASTLTKKKWRFRTITPTGTLPRAVPKAKPIDHRRQPAWS